MSRDPNVVALASRGRTHREVHELSLVQRGHVVGDRPQSFAALLGWFKREWDAEFPRRLHERGVEPESALGAPRLAGAMRARLTAIDDDEDAERARRATDYDPAHDTWSSGAAPRYPILDALERYGHRHPLLRRYLEAVAYGGFDWRRVAQARLRIFDPEADRFVPDDEHAFLTTLGALSSLWEIWSARQPREVA